MSELHLVDAHCHLDFESFDNDREQVIQRAEKNNISDIIIPGTQKKYWPRIRKLCAGHNQLHACYGLHPYWTDRHCEQDLVELAAYIEANTPVALGECGLDFRPQQADREKQLHFFEAQLGLAEKFRIPLVIHSVNATEVVIRCIKKFSGLRGMIHSYSGSTEQAKQLLDLGFLISISAAVTYDNAKKIRRVVRDIPLTTLLLETDAPDQPDRQHSGERNEPAYLVNTLEAIAGIREQDIEIIAKQTTANARALFTI